MQFMVYIYYYYYSSNVITWNTQQYLEEDLLISCCLTFFLSSCSFLFISSKSNSQRNITPLVYTAYHMSFCYVMYYIIWEISISGRFQEDCYYCYSQLIISLVATESSFPISLFKEHQECITLPPNATPSQIKKI